MTAPAVLRRRRETTRELYGQGLSMRQVADRLGVDAMTVHRDLVRVGAEIRNRHLTVVRDRPRRRREPVSPPPLRFVPPEGAAVAFTADRGWHMVEAPPGWFLDLLAEAD